MDGSVYTREQRALQDRFGTRAIADAHTRIIMHDTLTDEDKGFIESRDMVFLSTVDEGGNPTVSYKGGETGFVRVVDGAIVLPCYDGNGMFVSMGNVAAAAKVGLLFIDFATPHRLRVHGTARLVAADDASAPAMPGAIMALRVEPTSIFVNCSRYIHTYEKRRTARHVPDADGTTPLAEWKRIDILHDHLPDADRAAVDAAGTISFEDYAGKVGRGEA